MLVPVPRCRFMLIGIEFVRMEGEILSAMSPDLFNREEITLHLLGQGLLLIGLDQAC